jgi:Asp-tRNA(Asn)/Glu-tRNA(Gln) amidotransferase A subunit family amidase
MESALKTAEYAALDATALAALIARGEVTAAEAETAARAAVAAVNGDLNALARPLFDPALGSEPGGVLAGVPFLIKDSAPFARNVPFALGSRSVRGAVAPADHPMMSRFRAAGLVTIGQTTAPEYSLSFATESRRYGVTRNPWALDRGVGGSSGGAAALVGPARSRSHTATTVPDRCVSRPPPAVSSASSPPAAAHPAPSGSPASGCRSAGSSCSPAPCATPR